MKKDARLFKMDLVPGLNPISFPMTPLRPAIGDILPPTLPAESVAGFEGKWVTARRDESGQWKGNLTDLTGGLGYWVMMSAAGTIRVDIPAVDHYSPLPSVPVHAGWNLLGVFDAEKHAAGEPPGPIGEDRGNADRYFEGLDWEVAYTHEPRTDEWRRIVKGQNGSGAIVTGKGYWVWVRSPAVLTPCGALGPVGAVETQTGAAR